MIAAREQASATSIALEDTLEMLAESGELLLGKYRLERQIGAGGMGIVFEAWHEQLHEKVAIKLLSPELARHPEAVARFHREARLLFKIKSEHVCRVIDVGALAGGVPFMVMEHLEGHDLAVELTRRGRLPPSEAVAWILQAISGVAQAHVRGIVHRDLKPENLFLALGADGAKRVKLLDFGLSKQWVPSSEELPRERKLTDVDQIMGTPSYMAPEMWLSAADAGAAADQWALAAIVYELITGRPPFEAPRIGALGRLVLAEPMPPLRARCPEAPAALDTVLSKALEKHPADRYDNVGSFALALSSFARRGAAVEAEGIAAMIRAAGARAAPGGGAQLPIAAARASSDMAATQRAIASDFVPAVPGASHRAVSGLRQAALSDVSQAGQAGRPSRSRRMALAAGIALTAALTIAVMSLSVPREPIGRLHAREARALTHELRSQLAAIAAARPEPDVPPAEERAAARAERPPPPVRKAVPRPAKPAEPSRGDEADLFDRRW